MLAMFITADFEAHGFDNTGHGYAQCDMQHRTAGVEESKNRQETSTLIVRRWGSVQRGQWEPRSQLHRCQKSGVVLQARSDLHSGGS